MLHMLLAILLAANVEAGRLVVGSQSALFSEGILTWCARTYHCYYTATVLHCYRHQLLRRYGCEYLAAHHLPLSSGLAAWCLRRDDVLGLDSSATLYVSGKLGTSCGPTLEAQAQCALESVASTFSLGFGIPTDDHPMRWATECKVYLVDMGDYSALNSVYSAYFNVPGTAPPARLCLAVDELPVNGLVEVQCTGHCDDCPWADAHGLRHASNRTNVTATAAAAKSGHVTAWLREIGMVQYAKAFAAAGYDDIDVLRLGGLTAAELREIGVSKPGHLKKLLLKVAAMGAAAPAPPPSPLVDFSNDE